MNNIIFLDSETTDLEKRRLCQLAYKTPDGAVFNSLFRPPIPITAGASSVSHITNEDVADYGAFSGSPDAARLNELLVSHILVAHNAPFDISVLKNEGVETKYYICTQRVAQRVIKDDSIEKYSLQYLRYHLGLYKLEKEKYQAHDALGDISVLEHLFMHLFDLVKKQGDSERDVYARMMNLQNQPLVLSKIGFGKHVGMTFQELKMQHADYLIWLLKKIRENKEEEKDPDLTYTLRYYLGEKV